MTLTFQCHPRLQALGLHHVAFFSLVTLLRAGRQSAEDIFHAGHEAVHVTRLHRYEHEGISSLIEAEARWKSEAASPAILLRSRAHPKRQAFLRVSKVQEAALKAHQSAFMEAARDLEDAEVRDGRLVQDGKLIRYHGVEVPNENHPAETRLTSLESQYIGQIGVGSVLSPQGCQPSGESLIYLGPAEYLNATEEEKKACHVRDESLVWVVFDTGSTNIWVSSVLCDKGPCAQSQRSRYNRTNSRTYLPAPRSGILQIEFGTGRITGPEAIDDFHIGPFSVYKQTFGMIQSEEGRVFEEIPVEGILGLAFPAMAANGIRPFVDGIIENKAIGRNEFAFYFSPDDVAGNAIFWGGVDKAFYTGDIEFFPVVEPYYWAVELRDFKIGNDSLLHLLLPEEEDMAHESHKSWKQKSSGKAPMFKAIVDTGTTFFTAQGQLYKEVMKRLSAQTCSSITEQSHPNITYTLVNTAGQTREFVLNNKQYMLHSVEGDDAVCSPAFMMIQVPAAHGPGMVLGEVFLRIFFAVFDRGSGKVEEARLGLAQAMHDTRAKSRLKGLTANQPVFHRPDSTS